MTPPDRLMLKVVVLVAPSQLQMSSLALGSPVPIK